jgi:hypothetical protein
MPNLVSDNKGGTLAEGFENRVLRGIFGSRREEVPAGWIKLHNEEFDSLYSSPSIIRMIKSRSIRWRGNLARMGRKRISIGCWLGRHKERWHYEIEDGGV